MSNTYIAFDKYEKNNIKNSTREKWAGQSSGISHHLLPDVAIPKNCKQFLTNGNNKAGISKCYTDVFTEIALGRFAENQGLIIMGGQDNVTTEISKDSTNRYLN